MKRFLGFLILLTLTVLGALAQTATITGPSSPVAVATGAVTVTGNFSSATSIAVTITNNALGTTAASGNATLTGSSWSFSWTPTAVGDYLVKAIPFNGSTSGSTAAATLTIAGIAPTVSLAIGGSVLMAAGSARYLDATVTDVGAITSVQFFLDSVLLGTVSAPASGSIYSLPFTAPTLTGTHQLNAVATDNAGNTASSSYVTIVVTTPIGNPPTVGMVAPISGAFVPTGSATTISGNVADSDGTVAGVQVFANGVSIGAAVVTGGNWSVSWTPTVTGLVSLTAIATDNSGNSVIAPAVLVNVTDTTSPGITLAITPGAITSPITLPTGASRNILATVSPATGRAVVRVEFFLNGTKVSEADGAPYAYLFTAPSTPGTYVLSARATDNTGLARDTQATFLVISAVGSPPSISLLTPTNGTNVIPGTPLSLAAAASSSGSVSSVQFYANGSPAGITPNPVTASPYTATFTPGAPGTYLLNAIATDDRNNSTVSNAVSIVAAFGTPTISITTPSSTSVRATPNVPLTISALATPGTGAGVLLVEFLLDFGTPSAVQIGTSTRPTTTGGSTYSFAWTPTPAQLGTHTLTTRVTDTNSQVAVSTPAVTVTVANVVGTPPTVIITAPTGTTATTIQSLSTVNFIATAFATGTNNSLVSVQFFLNGTAVGFGAREQTTNLYRLAYNFAGFDFTTITPTVDSSGNQHFPLPLYAIAVDSNGNQTISATANLSISLSAEAPPAVTLLALGGTSVAQNTPFPMFASPSSPTGTVVTLQLFANGVATGGAIANPGPTTLVTYTPTAAGRFNLFVVATDDSGNTAISTPAIVLSVTAITAPTTAITLPADDSTVTNVGAPVFLQATASGSDPTQIPTVSFIATGSTGARTTIPATRIGTTTTYRAVWTPTTPDTYSVASQATVNTVSGTSAVSRRVVVNNIVGIAPSVSISFPSSVTSVSTANLVATATSTGGSIANVEFFINRNSVGQAVRDQLNNTWRLTVSFGTLTPGSYEIVALAHDTAGNITPSATGSVTVTAGTGTAPTVAVFATPASIALGQSITLTATAGSITGTVTSVTYYANALNLGGRTTPPLPGQAGYQLTWTTAPVGTFNIYAVATDSNNNTTVSASVPVTVRAFTPLTDYDAFILQTYTDITNSSPSTVQFANYDAQFAAGTITRPQLVTALATNNASTTGNVNFNNIVNALAAYYVIMGQWPTTANYTTIYGQRANLATVCGTILTAPEYVVKYGVTPTATLLSTAGSSITAAAFLGQLYQNAGLGTPSNLQLIQFMNNPTAVTTTNPEIGRGYTVVGLNTALADFITVTNANNTALINLATAAALYYQLDKPTIVTPIDPSVGTGVVLTTNDAATRIKALAASSDLTTMAGAVLQDVLYSYRFVTITGQPQSLVVAPLSGALFSVAALGEPPLTYQWLLNGAPIAGATNPSLSVTSIDPTKTGTYTVNVISPVATATSSPATLTLSSTPTHLVNISTRASTGGGTSVLIAGFVVATPAGAAANQTRQMLVRVVGPSLASQGLTSGFLADPRLEIYDSAGRLLVTNDNWGTQSTNAQTNATEVTALQQAEARAGAFPLASTSSLDAAVVAALAPGGYTVMAKGPTATATGIVLVEVYDASPTSLGTNPKAINVSTRGVVGTGTTTMIAGFVINGAVSRRILVRGVGPTLTRFGLPAASVVTNPQIQLFDSNGNGLGMNAGWSSDPNAAVIAAAAVSGGAFPLTNGSSDAAMLLMLPPGGYTVHLTGVNATTGLGLVEVYDVDP